MPEVSKTRTEKQRIRAVLQGLNEFFPKFAIQRAATKIQDVWDANELENPEAGKMLDELLAFLKKSKEAKTKASEMPDMPADFGREKSDAEIRAEEKLAKRTGQIEHVVVTGPVADPASVPAAAAATAATAKPVATPAKPGK